MLRAASLGKRDLADIPTHHKSYTYKLDIPVEHCGKQMNCVEFKDEYTADVPSIPLWMVCVHSSPERS
jgi:hypothetical protein